MAVTDNYVHNTWYGEGNRLGAVAINVPTGLANTMLLFIGSGRSTDTNPCAINSVYWSGNSFSTTYAHSQYDYNGMGEIYMWYQLNPDPDGAGNVTFGYDSGTRGHDTLATIVLLKNVKQTAPIAKGFVASAGTSNTLSSISTSLPSLLFFLTGTENDSGNLTVGSNQVEMYDEYYNNVQESAHHSSYKWSASPSESMSHSWVLSRDYGRACEEVQVLPAPGGATWIFSQMQNFYEELKRGLMPPDVLQKRYREVFAYHGEKH